MCRKRENERQREEGEREREKESVTISHCFPPSLHSLADFSTPCPLSLGAIARAEKVNRGKKRGKKGGRMGARRRGDKNE